MSLEPDMLTAARLYLAALERFARGEELARFFTSDAVQIEFPNRLSPHGQRRTLPELLASAERGAQILSAQRYDVERVLASGDHVALEVLWTGTLALPLGSLPAGAELSAHSAMVLEFRDGTIAAQRNYDCFDPF